MSEQKSEKIGSKQLRQQLEATYRACEDAEDLSELQRLGCILVAGFLLLDNRLQRLAIQNSNRQKQQQKQKARGWL